MVNVCDCCGQEMTRWHHVVTTPEAKEPYMNILDLIRYQNGRDMCEECYNRFLEGMTGNGK